MEMKDLLNSVEQDYGVNHDTDEIEIDADENAWKECTYFVGRFLENKELSEKCSRNAKAVHCRRAFSVKTDKNNRKRRYMDYDVEMLSKSIRNNPGILKEYKNLSQIFNEDGTIKIDFLFEKIIARTNSGREFCNYILNTVPLNLLEDKINSGTFNMKQIEILFENFVEVPHSNALALRELKNIDFSTYEETWTQINISEKIEDVYNFYFTECCGQIQRFNRLLEVTARKYNLGKGFIDSYRQFFQDYYVEMIENISIPNEQAINAALSKLENSDIEYLKVLSMQTRRFLQNKFFINNQVKNPHNNLAMEETDSLVTTEDMQNAYEETTVFDRNKRYRELKGDIRKDPLKEGDKNYE